MLNEILPLTRSGLKIFEKMLSINVLLPLVLSLVGSVIVGSKWFDVSKSKNSDE